MPESRPNPFGEPFAGRDYWIYRWRSASDPDGESVAEMFRRVGRAPAPRPAPRPARSRVYRVLPMLEAAELNGRQRALAAIMRAPRGGENFGRTLRNKDKSNDDAEAGAPTWRSNDFESWIIGDYFWQQEQWHRERHGHTPRGKWWWKTPTGRPNGRPRGLPVARKITDAEIADETISLNGYQFKPADITAVLRSGPLNAKQKEIRLEVGFLFRELAKPPDRVPVQTIADYFDCSRQTVWRRIAEANRATRVEVKRKPS